MTKKILVVLISTVAVVFATYIGVVGAITAEERTAFNESYPMAAKVLGCRDGFQGIQNISIQAYLDCKAEDAKSNIAHDPTAPCFKMCMWIKQGYIKDGVIKTEPMRMIVEQMYNDNNTVHAFVEDYHECYTIHINDVIGHDGKDEKCSKFVPFTNCIKAKNAAVCHKKWASTPKP